MRTAGEDDKDGKDASGPVRLDRHDAVLAELGFEASTVAANSASTDAIDLRFLKSEAAQLLTAVFSNRQRGVLHAVVVYQARGFCRETARRLP
jgi:hypothetical protein